MYIRPEMHQRPSMNDRSFYFTVVHIGLLINVYWTKKASEWIVGILKPTPSEPKLDTPAGELSPAAGAPEKKNHGCQSSPPPTHPGAWKRPVMVHPHEVLLDLQQRFSCIGFYTSPLSQKYLGRLKRLWKLKVKSLSLVWLFDTPWPVAYQASLSIGFSR